MKRIKKYFRRRTYKTLNSIDRLTGGIVRRMFFRSAQQDLLSSADLSAQDKNLLERVSLNVHQNDDMYVLEMGAHQYLTVGLSAIKCIDSALKASGKTDAIRSILDFPCGHGRVLRFLRLRFPDAAITASEIVPTAMEFCKSEFAVNTIPSQTDFNAIPLSGGFDLIWCGSLVTHLDERSVNNLLQFFYRQLAVGGLVVFTTHGPSVEAQIRKGWKEPLPNDLKVLLAQFQKKGFGYADYEHQRGYGNSLVTKEYMLEIAKKIGTWENVYYQEQGWANYQDVYGYRKTA